MPSLILNGNKIGGTVDDSALLRYSNEDSTLQASTIQDAVTELDEKVEANKVYTDEKTLEVKNDLLNGAGEAYDTLKELGDLINDNTDALDAVEALAATNKNKLDTIQTQVNTIQSHVGMIIHSTTLDTMEKVIAIYGGKTWTKIEGRMLLGQSSSYAVNSTGGSATNTLTTANLPSHAHSIPALSGTAASNGAHTHAVHLYAGSTDYGRLRCIPVTSGGNDTAAGVSSYADWKADAISAGAHKHTVTTDGSNTGNSGSGTAVNNMPPYKTVYIWERTA